MLNDFPPTFMRVEAYGLDLGLRLVAAAALVVYFFILVIFLVGGILFFSPCIFSR